jgi:hypothetical protein
VEALNWGDSKLTLASEARVGLAGIGGLTGAHVPTYLGMKRNSGIRIMNACARGALIHNNTLKSSLPAVVVRMSSLLRVEVVSGESISRHATYSRLELESQVSREAARCLSARYQDYSPVGPYNLDMNRP